VCSEREELIGAQKRDVQGRKIRCAWGGHERGLAMPQQPTRQLQRAPSHV